MTLTLAAMRDLIAKVERDMFDCACVPPGAMNTLNASTASEILAKREDGLRLLGMKVIESPYARLPTKKHKKRKWMSESYHRRIQKKWNKRFGYSPAIFLLNTDVFKLPWISGPPREFIY